MFVCTIYGGSCGQGKGGLRIREDDASELSSVDPRATSLLPLPFPSLPRHTPTL